MWRRPVTFGGGMTITNFGAPGAPDGWKRPSFSQREYQRSSKAAGSKVLSRPRAGVAAESIMADMKKGLFGALSYQNAARERRVGVRAEQSEGRAPKTRVHG